jgi:hypothetical protein
MKPQIGVRHGAVWALFGFVVCVLADGAVAYAVLESPVGTFGMFDDNPPEGSLIVPVVAGAVLGILQVAAFGLRVTVGAASAVLVIGIGTLLYVFPAGTVAVGCVLGAVLSRLARIGRAAAAPALALLLVAGPFAASYGLTRPDPVDLPLLQVSAVSGGPSLVIDPQERGRSFPILGTLTDVEGCLGVVSDRTGSVVVAWPKGTTAAGTPYELTYEGRTFRAGDSIYLPRAGLIALPADLDAYAPDLPASCRSVALLLAG